MSLSLFDELLLFEFELFAGVPWDREREATEVGSDFIENVFFDEPPAVLFLLLSDLEPLPLTPDVKCPMRVSTFEADLPEEPPPTCLELT